MAKGSNDEQPESDWGLPPVPRKRVPVGVGSPTDPGPMPGAPVGVSPEVEERRLADKAHKRRWLGLVVIAFSQLLIVVDATIVNVALPALSEDLELAHADRQWVVTAYSLAFGGLLLLGGRVSDYLGLRRAMILGLAGFATASAVGGAAQNLETLLAARAAQGVFGALLAPAALALLSTTFTDTHERAKAFAIFGVVAGGGSALGLIAGGMLTEYANWRWTMYVNVPLAVASVLGAYLFLDAGRTHRPGRLDLIGTVLGTGGLVCVVYSFSEAERNGWTQDLTLTLLGLGLSLLIMFVVSQKMVKNPLLPLRVLGDRTRAGSNLAITLAALSMIGAFFFLTFYLQGVLGFAPVKTGVAFLPVTGGVVMASAVISTLMPKVAPRVLMGLGLVGSSVALILISQMTADSNYLTDLLPALMLMGVAMGAIFVPAFNAATHGVQPRDAGVAGAVVNATQQIGASLGVALLSTVSANRTADYLAGREIDSDTLIDAQVEGYARASLVAGLILAAAAVLVVVMVNVRRLTTDPLGEMPVPGPVAEPMLVPTPPQAVAADRNTDTMPRFLPTGDADFDRMRERLLEPLEAPEPTSVSAAFADRTPIPASIPAVFMEAGDVTDPHYGAAPNGHQTPAFSAPMPPQNQAPAPVQMPMSPPAPAHVGPAAAAPAPAHTAPAPSTGPSPALRVTVRRIDGRAIASATVTLLDDGGRQVSRADSDGNGVAEFLSSSGGEYLLVVRHQGYLPQARTVLLQQQPAPTVEVEVLIPGAARLSGFVTNATGRAVEGALVTLTGVDGAVAASVRTDADGAYEMVDLTVEEGTLAIFAPSARPIAMPVAIPPGGRIQQDVVVRGSAVVSGIAQTPEGWLIADARVSLHVDGEEVAVTRTDADGAYSFQGLDSGTYTVIAVGYPPSQTEVVAGSGETTAEPLTLAHAD